MLHLRGKAQFMPLVHVCAESGCPVLTMGTFCVQHEQTAPDGGEEHNLVGALTTRTRLSYSSELTETTHAKNPA